MATSFANRIQQVFAHKNQYELWDIVKAQAEKRGMPINEYILACLFTQAPEVFDQAKRDYVRGIVDGVEKAKLKAAEETLKDLGLPVDDTYAVMEDADTKGGTSFGFMWWKHFDQANLL